MSLFGLVAGSATIEITFDNLDGRKNVPVKDKDGSIVKLPLFQGEDDISGKAEINIGNSKKLEHTGIRVELIGKIESYVDAKQSSDFMSIGRELESAGILTENKTYTFSFPKFEKQFETYSGIGVKLRYFVRITINRQYFPKIVKEKDFAVNLPSQEPELTQNIKMEVGIEECLHIEFEYNRGAYHLKDCVIGKVYFLLVRIKIKKMELEIVKKESYGTGANAQTQEEAIAKFEVMDGCPNKGDIIPIRLYLGAYDLTPSLSNVSGRFSVKYFLNLVLLDEDDRRYFKRQEITIWRKK